MHMRTTMMEPSSECGFRALLLRRQGLDHRIAAARRRAAPDRSELDNLEREALRLRAEIERYDGVWRTLSSGRSRPSHV